MLNRYKNMIVLIDEDPEQLVKQLKSIPYEFSIESMYGLNSRHYAFIVCDRPVKIVEEKQVAKKTSLQDLQNKFNSKG